MSAKNREKKERREEREERKEQNKIRERKKSMRKDIEKFEEDMENMKLAAVVIGVNMYVGMTSELMKELGESDLDVEPFLKEKKFVEKVGEMNGTNIITTEELKVEVLNAMNLKERKRIGKC